MLFSDQQCIFVSSDNIVETMRLIDNLSWPGDILALRRPADPFTAACFAAHLTACCRIGLRSLGLITFVGSGFGDKEIIF